MHLFTCKRLWRCSRLICVRVGREEDGVNVDLSIESEEDGVNVDLSLLMCISFVGV